MNIIFIGYDDDITDIKKMKTVTMTVMRINPCMAYTWLILKGNIACY